MLLGAAPGVAGAATVVGISPALVPQAGPLLELWLGSGQGAVWGAAAATGDARQGCCLFGELGAGTGGTVPEPPMPLSCSAV